MGQFSKNYGTFYSKKLSGKNLFRIPDPRAKKAPDRGSRIRIRNPVFRYAFAETDCAEMVLKAKEEMDDKEIEGRKLKVRGTKVSAPEYK